MLVYDEALKYNPEGIFKLAEVLMKEVNMYHEISPETTRRRQGRKSRVGIVHMFITSLRLAAHR
jgi:hypothetical protein